MSEIPKDKYITVYTDGSRCPDTKVGGWGVWLRWEGGSREFSGGLRDTKDAAHTEFAGAHYGLVHARHLLMELGNKRVIVLVTDCLAVQRTYNQIIHGNLSNNKFLDRYGEKIKKSVTILQPSVVRVKKVKAHDSSDGKRSWANDKVDKLAKSEMYFLRKQHNDSIAGMPLDKKLEILVEKHPKKRRYKFFK